MHDAPVHYEPPPPSIDDYAHHHPDHHDHYDHHHHQYNDTPPDEPPPSYDDATASESAPLLVGRPPNYGAFSDASSIISSEVQATNMSPSEWVGQIIVFLVLIVLIYGFWKAINRPGVLDGFQG